MKRRSMNKTKSIGHYSQKRKSPSTMMYGPTTHNNTHRTCAQIGKYKANNFIKPIWVRESLAHIDWF